MVKLTLQFGDNRKKLSESSRSLKKINDKQIEAACVWFESMLEKNNLRGILSVEFDSGEIYDITFNKISTSDSRMRQIGDIEVTPQEYRIAYLSQSLRDTLLALETGHYGKTKELQGLSTT